MNYTRRWLNSTGGQVSSITATGRYTLIDLDLGGKSQGTLALKLTGAGSATVKLETIDQTQIGDTMTVNATTPKILTASSAPVEITLAGPRILNVTAITGELVAEVYA
jgi:hypothetical protein